MNIHKFKGKWITHTDLARLSAINVFHRYLEKADFQKSSYQNKHILFRKSFTLDKTENAKIYISADDYYKLYINGSFVGCGPKSSYIHNCCYNEYDISDYLQEGINTLAIHTYYQGLVNRIFVSGDNRHGLICDIEQGRKAVISSDESFLCSYHSGYEALRIIGYDTQFTEKYNAGSAERDFYKSDFDDSLWECASYKQNADYILKHEAENNLVFEKIFPESITKTSYGYFFDFGKNYVGYLKFTAKGNRKDNITVRYGQELTSGGRVCCEMRQNCIYEDEMLLSGYTDTAEFFDYKAFRYAEIIGNDVEVSDVYLFARHYPFAQKSFLETDSESLKNIYALCIHTLKYGVQESVMDCPDREKGYYLGDGCYIALAHGKLTEDYTLFKALVTDALESRFISPSLATCLNCSFIQEIAEFPLIMVYCLELYLKLTGDKAFIFSVLTEIRKLLDYYRDNYTDSNGLICRTDKWCVAEWPDSFRDGYDIDLSQNKEIKGTHAVINAYYYKALCSFNSLANENAYDAEGIKNQYIKTFYDEKNKRFRDSISSNHQSLLTQLFSLCFGLCSEESEKEILSLVLEKGINCVNIFGSFPFLYYLHETDNRDLLINQFTNENAWLKMISEGATTTFECWGKDLKWNTSLFHLTHASAVLFMLI